MCKRFYIDDFVENLNYHNVILYVGADINLDHLYKKLVKDNCGHLYRFDYMCVEDNPTIKNFFYIANCDFQNLDYPVHDYIIDEGYNVYNLQLDDGRYFIEIDL